MQKRSFPAVFNQQSWPQYKKVEFPESLADSIRLLHDLQTHKMSEDCFRGKRRSYHHMRRN